MHQTQPAGAGAAGAESGNPLAIVSLVVAILALILAILFFPLGLILGILAIVLGVMGRKRVKQRQTHKGSGLALAGIIVGALATALALLVTVGLVALFSNDDTRKQFDQELKRQQQQQQQGG